MKTLSTIPDHLWMTADKVEQARRMIAIAVKLYRPRKVWALFSGGNDSACSTHVAMSTGLCDGVASINTTIGIRQTREHAQMVCDRYGWPLRWLTPPVSYEEICAAHGMPGPGAHDKTYIRLKERCIDQLVRDSKRRVKDRIILITGVRASESDRRMGHVVPIVRKKAKIWLAPIVNWDNEDKTLYQVNNGIPRNPVTPILGISGECLCGSYKSPGERSIIADQFPEAEALIKTCEARAAANCKPASWGERPRPRGRNMMCQQCERKNGDNHE